MDIRKERSEDLKRKTNPVDASKLIEKLLLAKNLPQHQKNLLIDDMERAFEEAGNLSLLRAFEEGILTENEWLDMRDNKGFEIKDMGTVLGAFFAKQIQKDKSDDCVIVTQPETNIYKEREFIRKRFGIKMITPEEGIEIMRKKNKGIDILTNPGQ